MVVAVPHLAADIHVSYPEPHEVTAPQLTTDGQIEQTEVASALLKLEANTDRPNLLRSQRALSGQLCGFVPGSFGKPGE